MRTALWLIAALFPASLCGATVTGITNAADFSTAIAPGSLATVFGRDFASAASAPGALPLGPSFNGVAVSVNGRPAPITFLGPTQVNIQIPRATPPGAATVTVTVNGQASTPFSFTVTASAPGIFQYGENRGVIQNQDYSLNAPANPAAGGSAVIVYLTGIGATTPPVADGAASPASPLSIPGGGTPVARIGGLATKVLFLGLTPGNVGLAQANIEVPRIASGEYPVTITVNGVTSRPATISVQEAPPVDGTEGLPSGAKCISGPVTGLTRSLQNQASRLADEITIGSRRLCATCEDKAPVYGDFVDKLEIARLEDLTADVCYDGLGTLHYVRLRP